MVTGSLYLCYCSMDKTGHFAMPFWLLRLHFLFRSFVSVLCHAILSLSWDRVELWWVSSPAEKVFGHAYILLFYSQWSHISFNKIYDEFPTCIWECKTHHIPHSKLCGKQIFVRAYWIYIPIPKFPSTFLIFLRSWRKTFQPSGNFSKPPEIECCWE